MAIDVPHTAASAAAVAKGAARMLGRLIKPGGWRYLMPEPPKQGPSERDDTGEG